MWQRNKGRIFNTFLRDITPEGVDLCPRMESKELKEQIKHLRTKLQEITKNRKLTDPEVIGASQMLDALLNEYQKSVRDER